MMEKTIIFCQMAIYDQIKYATSKANPAWLLGKLDRHLSNSILAMVIKLLGGNEQNGLGRLTENFNIAKVKPNIA